METADAVIAVLEQAYIDRVIPDLGLVVTLYDLLDIGDGYVFQSDGGVHHDTSFRVVAFRPSQGEVLVGEVLSQDERWGVSGLPGCLCAAMVVHTHVYMSHVPCRTQGAHTCTPLGLGFTSGSVSSTTS